MLYDEKLWQEARAKAYLSNEDIEKAKKLGLNPKTFMKNIPDKSEPWKKGVRTKYFVP